MLKHILKHTNHALLSLGLLGSLAACGPEYAGEADLGDQAAPVPAAAEASTQTEQKLCTSPSGCIGSPAPLWRKNAGFIGPCITGTVLDKGYVSINAPSYIVGTYYKKSWTDLSGNYNYNRYVQASYNTAHKYWQCEASAYIEYGYPGNAVHRHQDHISVCYGAACYPFTTTYSGWYNGHVCNH